MKRRGFISIIAGAGGSFLLPPTVLRRIEEISSGVCDPRVLSPDVPSLTIHALESYGRYILHLGDPEAEPCYPTLREFIENKGFYPDDDDSAREYLEETWFAGDESKREIRQAIRDLQGRLEDEIDGAERDQWLEWDYTLCECSMAAAFRYLEVLPLSDGCTGGDISMGTLSFIEGDHPGSNTTYVELDGLGAIASLQHRLNELGEGVRIEVD